MGNTSLEIQKDLIFISFKHFCCILIFQEAKDGLQACYNSSHNPSSDPEEVKQRAMADPEVQV